MSRPIRDTSSRTTSTSGKVLVAIPRDSTQYSYLRVASHRERGFFGRPVRCGLDPYASLDDAKLVVMRLPAYRRYASGYDLCGSNHASGTVLRTVYGSDRPSRGQAHTHANHASVSPATMSNGFTIIASGKTKRADLPAEMQNDAWALLNNGRFRDAVAAFEEQAELTAEDQAGHAIAMAMTGKLDAAADLLASMEARNAAMDKLSNRLKSQVAAMAELMEIDRPDAAAVLAGMAGSDASNGA
ncbi:MAG: hypothetical protein AAF916_03025 [Planctomycetota bacterium]